MQKSTCPYLKIKISSIHFTFGFGLQHLLNDSIISPFFDIARSVHHYNKN